MAIEKDNEQDEMIRQNAVRIARNEEAIKRQTEALEKIRDHYFPKKTWWKSTVKFIAKVCCGIFAYLGIAETVDWILNSRESSALAEKYAATAQRLFLGEGDAAGAVKCYEKAVEINPKESEYVMALTFMKGMAMACQYIGTERELTDEEQAQIDAAYAEATVLRTLRPDDPLPLVLMAQALNISGETNEAVQAVRQAVVLAPKSASVHVSACAIQYYAGDIEGARKDLAEAERCDDAFPLMILWKGMFALTVDHDAVAARKWFEKAIRRMPRLAIGYLMLGRTLLLPPYSDIAGARAAFHKTLVLDARLTLAMMGMAETYEREGVFPVARLWLDRALSCDGRLPRALVARARIDGALGDWKMAVRDLTKAIALCPFNIELYRERAKMNDRNGDAAGAAEDRRIVQALEKADSDVSW